MEWVRRLVCLGLTAEAYGWEIAVHWVAGGWYWTFVPPPGDRGSAVPITSGPFYGDARDDRSLYGLRRLLRARGVRSDCW